MGKYKYTDDELIELAKTFTSLSQFQCKMSRQYKNLIKRGLNKYVITEKDSYRIVMQKMNNIIYAYEDVDNRYVYIGRTYRKLRYRHKEHNRINRKTGGYDSVKRYFISVGKDLPRPKVLKDNLSTEESQYYEEYFCKEYADSGWNLINTAKVGVGSSSIGGYFIKYTEDYVRDYLESNHIEYRKDISRRVMEGIRRNNLEYIIEDMPERPERPVNRYSSYSKDEIIAMCDGLCNMKEILLKDRDLYNHIMDDDEFSGFRESLKWGRRRKYDVDEAVAIANGYKSRNDFKKGDRTAYNILKDEGIIDDVFAPEYENTPKRIVQIDRETNEEIAVYEGVSATAKAFGKCESKLRDALKGRRKTWCGYVWRYES